MKAPRGSLQHKLVALMVLTCTAVLVMAGAGLIAYDHVSFKETMARALGTRAAIVAANTTGSLAFENPDDARQVLAALGKDPSMTAAALYDAHGRLFATYPANLPASAAPRAAGRRSIRFDKESLVVFEPVVEGGRRLGTLYLRSDLQALVVRERVYALAVLFAIVGSVGVAFALSTTLQRGITRPVLALAETARHVTEKNDFSVRAAAATSRDEIGLLTEAFNDMLGEIQERDLEIRALNRDLEVRVEARTAELEATNRELESFSYSVSHDLRAPVRHIAGFAELLEKRSSAGLDDAGRRYLDNITDSAKRMGELIDDLLMFSRMGRAELCATHVPVETLVADILREMEQDLKGREIEWKIGALPEVQADPAMLRLVLTNLVSNALKYSRPRSPAKIEIGAEPGDGETILWVRDNGVGFDMQYAPKLFGVFQRLHAADEFEGTGIGLANVRRIVYRHGGKTWAEGEVDRGATFYFSLPERKEAA